MRAVTDGAEKVSDFLAPVFGDSAATKWNASMRADSDAGRH
jgi:hypothetical protein